MRVGRRWFEFFGAALDPDGINPQQAGATDVRIQPVTDHGDLVRQKAPIGKREFEDEWMRLAIAAIGGDQNKIKIVPDAKLIDQLGNVATVTGVGDHSQMKAI